MQDELIRRLLNGEILTDICKDERMPDIQTIFLWLSSENEECLSFQKQFHRLRQFQAELLIEEMLKIARDDKSDYFYQKNASGQIYRSGINRQHFQRCKLKIDTLKEALRQLTRLKNLAKPTSKPQNQTDKPLTNNQLNPLNQPNQPTQSAQSRPKADQPLGGNQSELLPSPNGEGSGMRSVPRKIRRLQELAQRKAEKKKQKPQLAQV